MSKEVGIIVLGIWIIIIPYLGVPDSWRTLLLVLSGLIAIALGFLLRSEGLSHGVRPHETHPFVENMPPHQPPGGTERHELTPHN
jgi:hypothetical protein